MSGVNSQIPLQYNPQPLGPNVGQAVGTANALMQFQNAQQEQQRQNKLRDILGSPGAIDKIGQPTPETMSAVMGVDPNVGLKLQQNALSGGVQRAQLQQMNLKRQEQLFDLAEPVRAAAMAAYSSAPGDEVAKRQAGQRVYTEELNRAFSGGQMSDEEKALANPTFDPVRVGAQSVRWQDMQKQKDVEKRQDRQEGHEKTREEIERERIAAAAQAGQWHPGFGKDDKGQDVPGMWFTPKSGGEPVFHGGVTVAGKTTPAAQDHAAIEQDIKAAHPDWTPGHVAIEAKNQEKQAGQAPGSIAADRSAIAADVEADPEFHDKSTGQKAAEVEHRYQVSRTATMDPEVATNLAKQYVATGNVNVFGGFRRNTQMMNQIEKAVIEEQNRLGKTPEQIARSSADFAAYTQGIKAFEAGGKLEPVVRSQNVAVQHLAVLQDAADALHNHDVRLFNTIGNRIAQEVGAPAPTDFEGVKRIVGTELVKAITGSAGALGDREALDADLKTANSPEQLTSLINRYKQLMAGQLSGLRQSYDRLDTGQPFDQKFLAPETQREVAKYAPKGGEATPGQAAPAPPDVAYLRANPDKAAMFDKHFGAGAAEKILGAKP